MSTAPFDTLSDLMEFGRLILTFDGDAVAVAPTYGMTAPEEIQYVDLDADGGAPDPIAPSGWAYLTGYTGQHGYSGPVMHPSEFIGGRMAAEILSTPGYYVAVAIDGLAEMSSQDINLGSVGWGVLRYVG